MLHIVSPLRRDVTLEALGVAGGLFEFLRKVRKVRRISTDLLARGLFISNIIYTGQMNFHRFIVD